MKKHIKSLSRLYQQYPHLETNTIGLPNLGSRPDNNPFSKSVEIINKAYYFSENELLLNNKGSNKVKDLGGGSPLLTKMFPPCKKMMLKAIKEKDFSHYPKSEGDLNSRIMVSDYLIKEGFKSKDGIKESNVVFTMSTTHAFSLIVDLIARPYDVVLMTAPNYGLFTLMPEVGNNVNVELLELSKDDNWLVNAIKLSNRIDEINRMLETKYKDKLPYIPKVVAFFNENPHNPLGKVVNHKNKNILEDMSDVCLAKGVFVIDDLIYKDLSYDLKDSALPAATYEKYFDNTITMIGLSKSYGLAALRSGVVIANSSIIRGIRDKIFQKMDSYPSLQSYALSAAFNGSSIRYREYKKYFSLLVNDYIFHLQLVQALVEGIDSISDLNSRKKISKQILQNIKDKSNYNNIINGIPFVKIAEGTYPESGFFILIDFTGLLNMKFEKYTIKEENDVLKFLFEQKNIKFLLGKSFSWPNKNQLIGRFTFALPVSQLVDYFEDINVCIRKLK